MDLYAETILDHYKQPRKQEPVLHADVTHQEINHSCGDSITLSLKIDGDRITSIGWTGEGCAISQAAMSMLAEELGGKSVSDADAINEEHIRGLLGVPVGTRRLKCALLSLHTLKNALRLHRKKPLQSWQETVGKAD